MEAAEQESEHEATARLAEAEHRAFHERFWVPMGAAIDAIPDGRLREIAAMGLEEGLAMNRIGLAIAGDPGIPPFEPQFAVGVGMHAYGRALERFDLHDADFRPRPSRDLVAEEDGAQLHHLPHLGEFEVTLGSSSERFEANYAPKFGVDASDMDSFRRVASRLRGG